MEIKIENQDELIEVLNGLTNNIKNYKKYIREMILDKKSMVRVLDALETNENLKERILEKINKR